MRHTTTILISIARAEHGATTDRRDRARLVHGASIDSITTEALVAVLHTEICVAMASGHAEFDGKPTRGSRGCQRAESAAGRGFGVAAQVGVVADDLDSLRPIQGRIGSRDIFGGIVEHGEVTGGSASVIAVAGTSKVAVNIQKILVGQWWRYISAIASKW